MNEPHNTSIFSQKDYNSYNLGKGESKLQAQNMDELQSYGSNSNDASAIENQKMK